MINLEDVITFDGTVIVIGNEGCNLKLNLDSGNIELTGANFIAKNGESSMMGKFLVNGNFVNIGDIESTQNATTITMHDNNHSIDTNPSSQLSKGKL